MVNWFIGSSDISARRLIDPCPSPITFPLKLNKPCRQLEDWSNRTHTGGRRVVLTRSLMADPCRTTKEGPCPLARAALTDRFLNTFLSRFVHSTSATSGKHRSVRRTIRLRRCSTPNRGCRRAARRLRRDRWTGGLSRELFQAIPCARGGCGRTAWAYADRFPPRRSISLVFFPSALSSLLARIRSIRARAVPRTLYSAIENEFIPSALPRSRYPNQRCMTPNDVYRTDGLPRTNCIYLHIENILTFLANFRAINKSIYSRVI